MNIGLILLLKFIFYLKWVLSIFDMVNLLGLFYVIFFGGVYLEGMYVKYMYIYVSLVVIVMWYNWWLFLLKNWIIG